MITQDTRLPIYTAMNVAVAASSPSATALQWTEDGQVCFATKSAIYLLTPSLGINIDPNSLSSGVELSGEKLNLGWFRNIVEFLKVQPLNWPENSQQWPALSLGSLDLSLRAVACSPSNLSHTAGCIVACLSSNMDLTLWMAPRNHLKGEWIEIQNVSNLLLSAFGDIPDLTTTLKAQTTSITWSPQANFGIAPVPRVDGSLFITGSRSGHIHFLRFDGIKSLKYLGSTATVKDGAPSHWITHLSCSQWRRHDSGSTTVAYATSLGLVGVVDIEQMINADASRPTSSLFSQGYTVMLNLNQEASQVAPADKRGVTALKWLRMLGSQDVLVYTKPGQVSLWYPQISSSTGPEAASSSLDACTRAFHLHSSNHSVGSSHLSRVSGIEYIGARDSILLSLEDGGFYVIGDVSMPATADLTLSSSSQPSGAVPPAEDTAAAEYLLTSGEVTVHGRDAFVRAESTNATIGRNDVNSISGMTLYDDFQTVIWIHEAAKPSDFTYKHDAKHNSMFVGAQLWELQNEDELFLQKLETLFRGTSACYGNAPLHLLRSHFLFFSRADKLDDCYEQLIQILDSDLQGIDDRCNLTSCTLEVQEPSGSIFMTEDGDRHLVSMEDVRSAFRRSLGVHLYGWDALLSLRLRLSFTDFVWQMSDKEKQKRYGLIAQRLLSTISFSVVRIIVKHLIASHVILQAEDHPFVLRMIISSLLEGSPEGLAKDAHSLSTLVPGLQSLPTAEACPACGEQIDFQELTSAKCPRGHVWARCTVTTFLLATPYVRTCIGCSRKSLLPLSAAPSDTTPNWLPQAARGWAVRELIEAVTRCLYCGNSFVS